MANLLERLAYHYGSDKSRDDHGYVKLYSMLFEQRRQPRFGRTVVANLTEVGVSGGQSLQMWAEYFPKARTRRLDAQSCWSLSGISLA